MWFRTDTLWRITAGYQWNKAAETLLAQMFRY